VLDYKDGEIDLFIDEHINISWFLDMEIILNSADNLYIWYRYSYKNIYQCINKFLW
jgi:hypothetical protein